MILVNFKGYGEWFIRDGNAVKLAVVRRTNNPFEDPQEWKPLKPYGPYSDEYPFPDDDNEERFHDRQLNCPDREREFDRDLRGIFMRDPDIRGKIYDTNGLKCFGADYMICGKYPEFGFYPFRGVFRLTNEDEEDFRLANFDPKSDDWDKFKDRIKILKPCSHPNSLFTKMVNEGKLSADIQSNVYFEIQKRLYLNLYKSPKEEHVPYILDFVSQAGDDHTHHLIDNNLTIHLRREENSINDGKITKNEKRIQSLKEFIEWLEVQAKNNNINEFNREKLDCTKAQLLDHLQKWEKYRKTKEPLWNKIKDWKNSGGFWSCAERKEICGVMGSNREKNKPSAYENLIY